MCIKTFKATSHEQRFLIVFQHVTSAKQVRVQERVLNQMYGLIKIGLEGQDNNVLSLMTVHSLQIH